jgi:hypothetical protein
MFADVFVRFMVLPRFRRALVRFFKYSVLATAMQVCIARSMHPHLWFARPGRTVSQRRGARHCALRRSHCPMSRRPQRTLAKDMVCVDAAAGQSMSIYRD